MEIKISNPKTHTLREDNFPIGGKYVQAIVGKLILLECKPEEALLFQGSQRLIAYNISNGLIKGMGKYLKPILVSEIEKKEVSNLVLCDDRNHRDQPPIYSIQTISEIHNGWILTNETLGQGWNPDWTFKVLALPEHFSEKDIQKIVDGTLNDGDNVLIETESFEAWYRGGEVIRTFRPRTNKDEWKYGEINVIKFNSSNKINLFYSKIEDEEKMLPMDKVKIACERAFYGIIKLPHDTISFDEWWKEHEKWFEENSSKKVQPLEPSSR